MPGPYYYWPGNPVEYAVRRSRTPLRRSRRFVSGKAGCQKESRYA
ncbi:hypothetical protein [Candidatus Spongiihabitans sp.]